MATILCRRVSTVFTQPLGIGTRHFAVKVKKGKDADKLPPPTSTLTKEVISKTVVGANIKKEGSDPEIKADSEYPDWLWPLADKEPTLQLLKKRDPSMLTYDQLCRLVRVENRRRIREKNAFKAKK